MSDTHREAVKVNVHVEVPADEHARNAAVAVVKQTLSAHPLIKFADVDGAETLIARD